MAAGYCKLTGIHHVRPLNSTFIYIFLSGLKLMSVRALFCIVLPCDDMFVLMYLYV